MNETLMHYTAEPFAFNRARTYQQREPMSYMKPVGFWVSVSGEDDWPSWCEAEEFGLESLKFAHRVKLAATENVLRLSEREDMDVFHGAYATETEYERRNGDLYKKRHWPIDWARVAVDYDGVIIAPYQWSQRLDRMWYYGWDCASGCIWNLTAIASVELAVSV